MNDDHDLDLLIAEITLDAYDVDEQLTGFFTFFENDVEFPVSGKVIGYQTEVLGIDFEGDERRGLVASVRTQEGGTYTVALVDVMFDHGTGCCSGIPGRKDL